MKTNFEIHIKKGLSELTFGMPVEDVVKLLGSADSVEDLSLEDADEHTIVLNYDKAMLTLFFEGATPKLECIEIHNDESTLFDKKIFDLTEKEIVAHMLANNYFEQDMDTEPWGEKRVSFEEGSIDFFFEDDELISIVFGK